MVWTYQYYHGGNISWVQTADSNRKSDEELRAVPLLLKLDPKSETSLQTQIFEQIRVMILEGRLRAGEALPASRYLSDQLEISRNTSILAYERLAAEGYIETKRSIGTFVSEQIPEAALYAVMQGHKSQRRNKSKAKHGQINQNQTLRAQKLVNSHKTKLIADFRIGWPGAGTFPIKTWSRLIAHRLSKANSTLTEYKDPSGLLELRQAITDRLRPARSVDTNANHVIIVGGCQDGLNLVCRLVMSANTDAVVETPCYQGAAFLFESFGARIYPIKVDRHGIDTSQLPNTKNAIAYVTPSHQYPLGVTMSLERRLELLAWANRTDSYIIEDDYDSDFRYKGAPIAALKGLDQADRVIYMGTFSKCLGPGLRLGYVVFPDSLINDAKIMKALMNNGQPWLEQGALADFMVSGQFERHIRRIRGVYFARRKALVSALNKNFTTCEVIGDDAGMHLVWKIPDNLPTATEVERRALNVGVGVYSLSSGAAVHYGQSKSIIRFLALGYSSPTEEEIDNGITLIAKALS